MFLLFFCVFLFHVFLLVLLCFSMLRYHFQQETRKQYLTIPNKKTKKQKINKEKNNKEDKKTSNKIKKATWKEKIEIKQERKPNKKQKTKIEKGS